ncbi:hypothetical protein OG205_25690 [Lentzea sp. NBC_00516]|uniref:hypothetical protein n=1 Tax=Lentzea sp. NBC_00516 TaxID=2903582 RepID=UPI002E7FBB8C|nr:hypothetical protein [Lentzea sp. NBC_00516]WUD21514.1 hypothetical protein OG205_25690 [Lentzea sp. NBC_00516]
MSKWDEHDLLPKVTAALRQDGRPYLTAYQLAIKLERAHPGLAERLGKVLGGAGIGVRNSLAEYLGGQLAGRIDREGAAFPFERAYLCNDEIREVRFAGPDGNDLVSSLTGSGYHLSIFRWRGPVSDA